MTDFGLEPVAASDPGFRAALAAAKLPFDDIETEEEPGIVAFTSGNRIVGYGRMQHLGESVLLRPIVILPEESRQMALPPLRYGRSYRLAMRAVFLSAETAVPFFESLGFSRVEPSDVPKAILDSGQLSFPEPSSSTVMKLNLSEPSA
ncbi:MAG TPA: hypothetical protein VGO04_10395 [Ensifer sp.]|jgi:arsenate reductase/amino-acid N-acetyltransferase|uniref:hypothetical protein n=1 Tax=Ensifer sp. TaxID=1872086 RepID=UPI002E1618DE|nr:hypothetical protein [Ensifer sp.]